MRYMHFLIDPYDLFLRIFSLLESTLVGESIDKLRMSVIIDAVADNPLGRPVLMKFLKDSIPSIQKEFNTSFNSVVYRAFMKLGNHLHTEEELLEVCIRLHLYVNMLTKFDHDIFKLVIIIIATKHY